MFSAAAESFLRQAREIHEEELRRFAGRVSALLQGPEPGAEAAEGLRRLHLTVAATKYPRRLDGRFVELLQTVLCSPKSPEQVQVLCAAILREMSPCNDLILRCDEIQDTKLLSLVSSVLLAQGNKKGEVAAVGQRVVKVLEGRLPEGQSALLLLPVLANVINLSPESLTEEQTDAVSRKLADWLRYASTQQGIVQPSGGFFSSPRTKQPAPVTEVDGAIATDFFTVLSVGQHYTQDQWLNVQAFSMLRNWLLFYGGQEGKAPNPDDKPGMDRSVTSMVSTTSTSSRLLPPKEHLREKAFEYCQRLIEQSTRRPLKKDDGDLQRACLIEAVTIMDIICKQDSSYVYRAVSFLKILHGRICGDATYARALLPIAQFFLNHSTAIEIFHLLLDLPCLTAALDIQLRAAALPTSEKATSDPAVKPATCLEAFRHPLYKSTFQHFLRTKSAPEDTPESLIPLRQLLGSLAGNPRVVQCAETVPVLLELFFRVMAESADGSLINQLVVLLLQRSDQLYEIPTFKDDVYRVLSSQLAMLCKLHPALVVELSTEILEFSGAVSNIQSKEPIFTHVVWAVGEYLSVSYDKRCTVEQITRFFETLEAVLFEITQLRPLASTPSCAPRAISVLMATLTKLAARSQDLIPRVSMFLSKMRTFVQSPAVTSVYCEEDLEEILIRATELMNLLKMPSVAQFVFNPPMDVASTRLQREVNDSLPLALRMVTHLLEPAPGCTPV
ncbi:PREDICTED: AP-5 complex subunit zeta-1 isoform X2 [Lepidothrix coronata]|uniref:AP-5 complex subunit zeta-1 isoform X2 n=1 Tax=Lepidothrix coronata TaxID=321398 RepID=A0A6J0H4M1_9PASS|nr:PREDICTED: AP-5 complex subunit zeta-1 isoform X2 [Lepidothrix coronata]